MTSAYKRNFDNLVGKPLTDREINILQLTAEGQSNKQIAAQLELSPYTVKTYFQRLTAKLGTGSRAAMVAIAFRQDVIH